MNNKKQLTKVSVLIDKLNYLNDNLDFNLLKINDLDFNLLKSYTAELWQLLQNLENDGAIPSQDQTIKEQLFHQLPKTSPSNIKSRVESSATISKKNELAIQQASHKKVEGTILSKNEGAIAKPELAKDATENIFDTVKAIKKQHKVEPSPKVEQHAFQAESKPVKEPAPKLKEEPKVLVTEKQVEVKDFDFMPSKVKLQKPKGTVDSLVKELEQEVLEQEALEQEEENPSNSLNDRFKTQENSLGTVLKTTKTNNRNFKELIDINDRFLFIQSLFGGSYLAFEEAIKQINKIESYSEALDYVDYKLKGTYDWSTDSTEVTKFLNILERSYN